MMVMTTKNNGDKILRWLVFEMKLYDKDYWLNKLLYCSDDLRIPKIFAYYYCVCSVDVYKGL